MWILDSALLHALNSKAATLSRRMQQLAAHNNNGMPISQLPVLQCRLSGRWKLSFPVRRRRQHLFCEVCSRWHGVAGCQLAVAQAGAVS